jgi:competence protein ComEA
MSLGIPIGLNSATFEDLKAIPGLGNELATRIIDYRASIGEFESIDELDNIEGIGKKRLAIIKKVGSLD